MIPLSLADGRVAGVAHEPPRKRNLQVRIGHSPARLLQAGSRAGGDKAALFF